MTRSSGKELLLVYTWMLISALEELEGSSWTKGPTGKFYINLQKTKKNKEESRRLCEAAGGYLPMPKGRDENDFLKTLTKSYIWLGMNDNAEETKYVWDNDSSRVEWEDWGENEISPDSTNEQCAGIIEGSNRADRYWADDECKKTKDVKVICEKRDPVVCGKRHRVCTNSQQCIHEMAICDGRRDCADNSDEEGCETLECPPHWEPCNDGLQCMFLGWKCDGIKNCRDGSDEPGEDECKRHNCYSGYMKCADQRRCLPEHKFCDGREDCVDGSDERKSVPQHQLPLKSSAHRALPALLSLVPLVVFIWLIINA